MLCGRPTASRNIKLTVVGDKTVGKTALLKTYATGNFPRGEYTSTVFPFISDDDYVYSKSINYSGTPVLLAMWDRVYSQKEDDFIRSLQYNQTSVFLLCFSVVDVKSFQNIFCLWKNEIEKHCSKSSCLLVGLKKDLRDVGRPFHVVTRSMGGDMAEKIGAVTYVECSAKTRDNLKEVFHVAIQSAMHRPPHRRKSNTFECCDSRLQRLARLL